MTTTLDRPPAAGGHAPDPVPLDQDSAPDAPRPRPPSPFELPDQSLQQFLTDHNQEIRQLLIDNFRPTYDPAADTRPLPALRRPPLGAQELAIRATADRLDTEGYASIVAEMGVGKTYMAIVAAAAAKKIRRVIVLVPPHLVNKWRREVLATLPVNSVHAVVVSTLSQLQKLHKRFSGPNADQRMLFVIMSHWQAKTSYYWRPASINTNKYNQLTHRPYRDLNHFSLPACPDCGAKVLEEEDINRFRQPKPKHQLRCKAIRTRATGDTYTCNGPLWSADNRNPMVLEELYPPSEARPNPPRRHRLTHPSPGKDRRVALADYIAKKMPGFFHLTIADEMHQFKAKGSAQGITAGNLTAATGKSLTLTGTLMGGQATTIFYLLHRFSPAFRRVFGYHDTSQWRSRYGFVETSRTWKDDGDQASGHGAQSKRKDVKVTVRELPGITPGALYHIIGHTIFLKLRDVSDDLPPYEEFVSIIPMSQNKAKGDASSQSESYRTLEAKLKTRLAQALQQGSKRLLGVYLQALLAYPDAVTHGETAKDPASDKVIADIPPLSDRVTYPKEKELLKIVKKEKTLGRKVLVYTTHVDRRDITARLQSILTKAGHRALVMRSSNTDTQHREEWIRKHTPACDVMITNPSLVETGLDLIEYPTIVWFEPEYSVFTVRQASRRSWRIGQRHPVRVHHLVYADTMQTQALKHIALKAQTSLAIEGEIPQQGLTEYGSGGQDITMQLAKQLLGQIPDDGISALEAMQMARRQEDRQDEILVDTAYQLRAPDPSPQPAAPAHRLPEPSTDDLEPGQQISMHAFLFPD